MKATVKLILRESFTKKDGSHPIYLRLTINRRSKYYSLGISAQKKDLYKDKFQIKPTVKNSALKNIQINETITKARQILNDFAKFSKPPTFIEFDLKFRCNYSSKDFYEFANHYIDTNKKLAKDARRTYKSQITKMMQFKHGKLSLLEVNNLDFIKSYENYMIEELKNKPNTIYKSLAFIRTIINEGIRHSIIQDSVFTKIKLSKFPGKREFLTLNEVHELEQLMTTNKLSNHLKNVLGYFLFSCYTGLRYTDIKELRFRDIIDYHFSIPTSKKTEKKKMIYIEMHKTKREVNIPLIPQALQLISFKNKKPAESVFRVLSNQKTNKALKDIMGIAQIHKKGGISFHCARHSFASNSIAASVPLPYVSQLLGHTATKTTELYVKIIKDTLFLEVEKLANR